MYNRINSLIVSLSNDPFNPVLSLNIAIEYENIGQTASAVSFYLRTAEYGYYSHPEYVYASLLKSAHCFSSQKHRENTVVNLYLKAIAYLPSRPEAWFLLARWYERNQKWQESYTTAEVGISLAQMKFGNLPVWVDYPGEYGLRFEKAVSGWWVGRKDESIELLKELLKEDIHHIYRIAIHNNLKTIDDTSEEIDPLEPVVTNYRKYFGTKAPLIIDIGTRDGDDANYLYKELLGTKVIAVDANPKCYQITKNKYPWMHTYQCAVADKDGETTFTQVTDNNIEILGTSSVFSKDTSIDPPASFYKGKTQEITVPTSRVDTLLVKTGDAGVIDVVKIDTEGYSWQVLQGFGERLKDVKVFHIETESVQLHPDHVTGDKVADFMRSNGFVLVDTSHEWGGKMEDQIWVNPALATRNKECFNPTNPAL
jgi:tetratricopeptide (TPR) repeat protein